MGGDTAFARQFLFASFGYQLSAAACAGLTAGQSIRLETASVSEKSDLGISQ
jgi:hypothetical protein